MCDEYISVRRDAIEYLKKNYPVMCEKSGLCERIGGQLYTRTTLAPALVENGQKDAIAVAYGYLWHVNNEPGTPNQYPPERAAYEARKVLRDLMTHEQRGEAINRVRELMTPNAQVTGRPPAEGGKSDELGASDER